MGDAATELSKCSLFELAGGLPVLQRVHKIFYDKVYAHPWLGKFFEGLSQEAIEFRQTAFMARKMGAGSNYFGKEPKMAHRQMYITEELFQIRRTLLEQSLLEAGVPAAIRERWLRIDSAFKRHVVKASVEDFYKTTWKYEKRRIIPRPGKCPVGR